jgi:hypothetical protein
MAWMRSGVRSPSAPLPRDDSTHQAGTRPGTRPGTPPRTRPRVQRASEGAARWLAGGVRDVSVSAPVIAPVGVAVDGAFGGRGDGRRGLHLGWGLQDLVELLHRGALRVSGAGGARARSRVQWANEGALLCGSLPAQERAVPKRRVRAHGEMMKLAWTSRSGKAPIARTLSPSSSACSFGCCFAPNA